MFPRIVFGKCKRCQAGVGVQNSSADSSENLDETGIKYELVYFRGDYICQLCKERILMEEETSRQAERNLEKESFRSRAGFKNTI